LAGWKTFENISPAYTDADIDVIACVAGESVDVETSAAERRREIVGRRKHRRQTKVVTWCQSYKTFFRRH